MRLSDTNLLVYAINEANPFRPQASRWLEGAFNSDADVGFAWLALIGFVRLTTQRAVLPAPLTVAQAIGLMDEWVTHPRAKILSPTVRHADLLAKFLLVVGCAGNLTNDAHLAALAVEHDVTVGTFDRDVKKLPGVKVDLLTQTVESFL